MKDYILSESGIWTSLMVMIFGEARSGAGKGYPYWGDGGSLPASRTFALAKGQFPYTK